MRKALAIQAAQLGETASNDGEPELDADAEILSSCPSSAAMDIILKTLPYAVPATLAEMSKVQKWLKERDLWPATCEQQQRFLRASVAALVGVQELDRKTTYDEMLFIVATFRKTPPSSGKPREDPSSPGDEDVKSKLEIATEFGAGLQLWSGSIRVTDDCRVCRSDCDYTCWHFRTLAAQHFKRLDRI